MPPPSPRLSSMALDVRRLDRDHFVTALFAPPDRREDLLALHAFTLDLARVREVVREPLAGMIRLQWWRDTVDRMGKGLPLSGTAAAVAAAVARHRLDRGLLVALIDSRSRDLDSEPFADTAALLAYLGQTTAPLVRLGLGVLAPDGEQTPEPLVVAAERVALAFALTGVLRAVPYHAATGRVLLPADRLAAAGSTPDAVRAGGRGSVPPAVVAELAATAEGLLRAARRAMPRPRRTALPLFLPALIADGSLVRLRRSGLDVFDPALATPRPPVARMALAWLSRHW